MLKKSIGDCLQTLSYGGLLRYTIEYDPEILFYPDLNMESLVIIRGGESLQRTIQFKIEKHIVDIENVYTIPMREVSKLYHQLYNSTCLSVNYQGNLKVFPRCIVMSLPLLVRILDFIKVFTNIEYIIV